MQTAAFSKTYNLFRLDEILAIIKECFDQLAISETTILSGDKCATLEGTGEDVTIKVTLTEGAIDRETLPILRGKPKVKIGAQISSDNSRKLARFAEEFENCLFRRVVRGGG